MFLRIIKRQIAAHLEHRTVLHQPAIILLSECSLLSQGGLNTTRIAFTLPTSLSKRLFAGAIHIGSDTSVNIVFDEKYQLNNSQLKFIDNFAGIEQNVTILWLGIGF
ncbi:MAG: hypothetical protein ACLR85_01930 [Veillonella sp.]|jgi:hypothetical protein|uniref:hypothetical protein n=1 Tax=Veillonella sp. TaxID=1926307 RepID=UPI00205D4CE6|nr:MAG TPA: hypothetical protein [Caudoviricetes sp.]